MKNTVRALALALVLLIIALPLIACHNGPKVEEGERSVSVVVYMDSMSISAATFLTKQENLLGALKEANFIESEEEPILTVCGITIDPSKKQVWKITKGGEPLETAASATPLENGDRFEITLTLED